MDGWLHTTTGTRISQLARLEDREKIVLAGNITINEGAILQSQPMDTSSYAISIGKYSYLGKNCKIMPPMVKPGIYSPVTIGGYCIIGENSSINCLTIGNRVLIEPNCQLQNLSVIYDCCFIEAGTIIPTRLVVPPYSKVSGVPGKNFKIEPLNSSYKKLIELQAKQLNVLG